MMNLRVTYERSVNQSFMKIPAIDTECLDEKLMLRKNYRGILPVERCYVNGAGEYWYNISGKQALDTYCKTNGIGKDFFETLILRICSQIEILGWNLIDTNCLAMDPEFIFVNHSGDDIAFVLYPDLGTDFFEELQKLMEYLLTKLNHEDKDGILQPYRIYEMSLNKQYNIEDLKQVILNGRESQSSEVIEERASHSNRIEEECVCEPTSKEEDIVQRIEAKIIDVLERIKKILWSKRENKEEIPMVVYPEEEKEERDATVVNPTICLAATLQEAKGHLLYEGIGDYPDFELEKGICILGKNPRVRLYLNRETISQFHAKFDYWEETYYIEDMNSTNGTYVNDETLNYKEKKALSPGDVIRFADVKYRFL